MDTDSGDEDPAAQDVAKKLAGRSAGTAAVVPLATPPKGSTGHVEVLRRIDSLGTLGRSEVRPLGFWFRVHQSNYYAVGQEGDLRLASGEQL